MPPSASLDLPATRRVVLAERRQRRLLAKPRPIREWTWLVQLWFALALPITSILYVVDIPGGLELHGWIANAFVFLPGPVIASAAATVRAIGMLNPETRAIARRIEVVRSRAAFALEAEMAALDSGEVMVEEHALDVRRAWCLAPEDGASSDPVTWVLVGDTHALIVGGELPSTRIRANDQTVPRHWIVERLPRTRKLLSLRTIGSSIPLRHASAPTKMRDGDCVLTQIERMPIDIARATVGIGGPYRG